MSQAMSRVIDLTAVVRPKSGKTERFIELFGKIAKHAKDHEPGTLRYELHRGIAEKNNGSDKLVVREAYADETAEKTHVAGPLVQDMIAEIQGGDLVQDIQVIYTKPGVGFQSKL